MLKTSIVYPFDGKMQPSKTESQVEQSVNLYELEQDETDIPSMKKKHQITSEQQAPVNEIPAST